jgi:hypothetical protein
LRGFFENENFRAGLRFRTRQRGKKTGRAAAHNPDAPWIHSPDDTNLTRGRKGAKNCRGGKISRRLGVRPI